MTIRVLVVEDNPGDARLVREALRDADAGGFEAVEATTLDAALDRIRSERFDVVLLDLSLPDSHGVATIVKLEAEAGELPLVVLTGAEDEALALSAMRSGAQDYLVKGQIRPGPLARSLRYAIERKHAAIASAPLAAPTLLADIRRHLDILEAEHTLLLRLIGATPASARETHVALEPGAKAANRYRLERLLGEGTSGRAFLARDETLERAVVLKALHKAGAAREHVVREFMKEARLAASLDHPNVIRIYDFGFSGETPYIVMEHAPGGSLAARIAARGSLDAADAERVLEHALDGLAHIHERGVLHRDLKPGNILLASDGVAKIADFGLALAGNVRAPRAPLDEPRFGEGTPAYMSPEAVRGLPITPASDLYSLGAVLYEALTGETYLPFKGRQGPEVREAILNDPPKVAHRSVPARLQRVLARTLEKDPRRRYQTAREMRAALRSGPQKVTR